MDDIAEAKRLKTLEEANTWLKLLSYHGSVRVHASRRSRSLRERMKAIAHERRRFGYRRVHILLKREGYLVNHKTLFRLYREEKLAVRRRGSRKRAIGTRAPMMTPLAPNERWGLDVVSDQLTDGRRFRILAIVDDCTCECLALVGDTSLSGLRVARELDRLIARRGRPKMIIISDNGRELTSNAILAWAGQSRVTWHCIAPGKLMQNALTKSFKGRLRDGLLNETRFTSLAQARIALGCWRADYKAHARISDSDGKCLPSSPSPFIATGSGAALRQRLRASSHSSHRPKGETNHQQRTHDRIKLEDKVPKETMRERICRRGWACTVSAVRNGYHSRFNGRVETNPRSNRHGRKNTFELVPTAISATSSDSRKRANRRFPVNRHI
jgi:putative transposase